MKQPKSEFEYATRLSPAGKENVYLGEIPDHWQQGAGAFGGVTIGLLARAIVRTEPDRSRRLRSLSADLCGPALPGAVEVHVSVLRRGRSVTFLDAQLRQQDAVLARASASLALPRAVPSPDIPTSPPQPPAWRDVATLPIGAPMGPVFADKYEFRPIGPLPFSGAEAPRCSGWIREKTAPQTLDEAAIVGLLDTWWPAALAMAKNFRAIATIGYTMQLLMDPQTLDPNEPLFFRGQAISSCDNFVVEMRELWSGSTLVALNQQTLAFLS